MRNTLAGAASILAVTFAASSAQAGAYGDALGKCLVDSSTGKDRVILVQWIFSALSTNPDVKPMTSITQAQRDGYNRAAAQMIERLVLKDCRTEALAAVRNEGEGAMRTSFQLFGQVAARSLMSDDAVTAELDHLGGYMDKKSWVALEEAAVSK